MLPTAANANRWSASFVLPWSKVLLSTLVLPVILGYLLKFGAPTAPHQTPKLGRPPLSFVPNSGQTDPSVRFLSHVSGGTIFFTLSGVVLSLPEPETHVAETGPREVNEGESKGESQPATYNVARMSFVDANPAAHVQGGATLPGKVNYFLGNDPSRWHRNLPTHAEVSYRALYSGIDLTYTGADGQLKGTFIVAPNVDPSLIRWRYAGAESLFVDQNGNLHVRLARGECAQPWTLMERAPVAWQGGGADTNTTVDASYTVAGDGTISFKLGHYDGTQPLIIDPTLSFSTYLGGSGADVGNKIATDANGNVYLSGYTTSSNFPVLNPLVGTYRGGTDAFVTKLSPGGTSLVYSTYFGGSAYDSANDIAVDALGSAYITGHTNSTDLPVASALQTQLSDGYDAFIGKLWPDGSLSYSTYLGGSGRDRGMALAVDVNGNAYVAGDTKSSNFPLVNPVQSQLRGNTDAFIAKLNRSGTGLAYSTYLGGTGTNWASDLANDIAVDDTGSAYVTGSTGSADFPIANPFQSTLRGDYDAYLTKLSPTGANLVYSTFLGGSGNDGTNETGNSVAVDSSGHAYVVGSTFSSDFPVANAYQSQLASNFAADAFLTKFSPSGTGLVYSTYLGGGNSDQAMGVAVDAAGSAYLVGDTRSSDFPLQEPIQPSNNGERDLFITRFNPAGSQLVHSTYLGGQDLDYARGIAIDGDGSAYLTGYTSSNDFPTANAYQPQYGGGVDAFLSKIAPSALNTATATSTGTPPTLTRTPTDVPTIVTATPACSTVTYYSTDIPKTIHDFSYVDSTLTITGGPNIISIEVVSVNISHTDAGALDVFLIAPTYNNIRLFREPCYDSWRAANTGFNIRDDAPSAVGTPCVPEQGTYHPEERLDILHGLPSSGTWTLRVVDNGSFSGLGGRLNGWGVRFTTGEGCPTYTPTRTPLPTNTPTATSTPDCGLAWRTMPSPNHGEAENFLYGLDVISPNSIWAVGYGRPSPTSPVQTLTMHWDGTQWSIIPSPIGGNANSYLYSVSAFSENEVWAVGYYLGPYTQTLAMRWDGTAWTLVPTPNPSQYYNILYSVKALGPNDVWAVGYGTITGGLAMRWNGTTWTNTPLPNQPSSGGLNSLSALGPNDIWAVGYHRIGGGEQTWTVHWNGTQWSEIPSPSPTSDENYLYSVAALSANDVWAVGTYQLNGGLWRALTMHWNGTEWEVVPTPNIPGSNGDYFYGVTALSPNEVWAVGTHSHIGGEGTVAERWDGTQWSLMPSSTGAPGALRSVEAVSAQDIWAVGSSQLVSNGRTLVRRWNYQCNSPTPTATITGTPAPSCGTDSNYRVTQATGAALVPGTTLVPGSQCTFCAVPVQFPFSYRHYGQTYNGAVASINGILNLTGNMTDPFNECIPYLYLGAAIVPHWDSLTAAPGFGAGLGIYTSVSGQAPNRIFNIEWRACKYNDGRCAGVVNFEVRLYEGQDRFDIVYGYVTYNGRSATIGVQNSNGSRYTRYSCYNEQPVSQGLQLTFTQPPCGSVTPTPTGSVPTNTSTLSPTSTPIGTSTMPPTPPAGTPTRTTTFTHTSTRTVIATATYTVNPNLTATPCTLNFSDVPQNQTFYEFIRCLACRGIVSGYSDGTFRPGNDVTRGQLSKIVANAAGYTQPVSGQTFTDVPPSHTFYEFIERMAALGIIGGYSDGTFRPGNNATRGQISKIVSNAAGFNEPMSGQRFSDVPPSSTFYEFIERLASRNILGGYSDGTFRPGNNATRGQVSKIVANTFFHDCNP